MDQDNTTARVDSEERPLDALKRILSISHCGGFIRDEMGLNLPWDDLVFIQEALTRTMRTGEMEANRRAKYDLAEYHARIGRDESEPYIKEYIENYPEPEEDVSQILSLIDHYRARTESGEVKTSKETFIYLMKDYNTGYTKIGRSLRPKVRESTLQSEKPTVILLWYCQARERDEGDLHRRFSEKRVRGEWFNLTDADIKCVISQFGGMIVGEGFGL